MLSKSPVIDLQSILNPAPHTPWSPPLLFVTVPQGRETNDVPFQNIYWRIVASQCCLVVAVQQSESAIHIHAPLLFQSFFPFRSRLPWWLRWFSSAYNAGDPGSIPGSGRCPGEGNGTPRHGWRNLAGYSPRGHKESDVTEQLPFLFTFPFGSLPSTE